MSKMLQVRDVPDDVHAALRARAVANGMSLSQFVLRELEAIAARPSKVEVLSRAAHRGAGAWERQQPRPPARESARVRGDHCPRDRCSEATFRSF